jgi:hypothetical protein
MNSNLHPASTATAAELHRQQRELVLASLLVRPGTSRPTHRRWA